MRVKIIFGGYRVQFVYYDQRLTYKLVFLASEILSNFFKSAIKFHCIIYFYELSRHFKNSSLPAGVEGLKASLRLRAYGISFEFNIVRDGRRCTSSALKQQFAGYVCSR